MRYTSLNTNWSFVTQAEPCSPLDQCGAGSYSQIAMAAVNSSHNFFATTQESGHIRKVYISFIDL